MLEEDVLSDARMPPRHMRAGNDEAAVISVLPTRRRRARPLFDPPIVKRRHPRLLRQAESPHPGEESGDVRGGSGRGAHHHDHARATSPAARRGLGFSFQIALWLWFTVLFANFAEAMAEGRGKAQADTLRKTKTETIAKRFWTAGKIETDPGLAAARRRRGDLRTGRHHSRRRRSDRRHRQRGRIGHHRRKRAGYPRIGRRPQRRHRRHQGAIRFHQDPHHLQSGRNLSRSHDRAGGRRAAAEDAQRNRAEHPDRRPDADLPAGRGHTRSHSRVTAWPSAGAGTCPASPCWFRCWSA